MRRTAAEVAKDRIELLGLELRATGERAGRAAAYLAVAALLAFVSWIGLLAAASFALAQVTSPALALCAIALANAGLAALLLVAGRRALRTRDEPPA